MKNKNIDWISLLKRYMLPDRIMYYADTIAAIHRMPASDGFYYAANRVKEILVERGVETRILEYRADNDVRYLSIPMFRQWDCFDARLEVEAMEQPVLCDFFAQPMSVIMHSMPVDFRDGAEIVYLPEDFKKEDYEDVDFRGRLIFSSLNFNDISEWAFKEKGAVAFITDKLMSLGGFRTVYDVPDTISYTRFDRSNERTYKASGFVLSPRKGNELRILCKKMEKLHQQETSQPRFPVARGYIDAAFKSGKLHMVESEIKGTGNEVLIISAHLCHPRPCANDDASGCAGAMEFMVVLSELIERKMVPRPVCTIRMLLGAEVTSTSAYLACLPEAERRRILAGVHFDMIGAKASSLTGPIGLIRTPDMLPSFVNTVLENCATRANTKFIHFNGEPIPFSNFAIFDYLSGSDHQVYCDPAVGIPCPAFLQWPDPNYHTSGDTPEKLDTEMIRNFASAAGAYLLTLSSMNGELAVGYLEQMYTAFAASVEKQVQIWRRGEEPSETLRMRLQLKRESAIGALNDIQNFLLEEEWIKMKPIIDKQSNMYKQYTEAILERNSIELNTSIELGHDEMHKRPKRKRAGTITYDTVRDFLEKPEYCAVKKHWDDVGVSSVGDEENIVCYWMDGRHTIYEIEEFTSIQCNSNQREFVRQFIELMIEAGEAYWEE